MGNWKLILGITLATVAKSFAAVPDTVNIENQNVYKYLKENTYTTSGQATAINKYLDGMDKIRLDHPNLVKIALPKAAEADGKFYFSTSDKFTDATIVDIKKGDTECIIKNPVPGTTVYSKAVINNKEFINGKTYIAGKVRMIYVPSVTNVRDMGGWDTDFNKKIQYGLVYRGGELDYSHTATQEDIEELKRIGIGADMDLRDFGESNENTSAFGENIPYIFQGHLSYSWKAMTNDAQLWKKDFEFLVDNLRKGRAVYIHCIYGADRTGLACIIAGGLLGMNTDALVKDYELTSMAGTSYKRDISKIKQHLDYINGKRGYTNADRFYQYFKYDLKVSEEDIQDFRKIMLDGYDAYAATVAIDDIIDNDSNNNSSDIYDLSGRKVVNPGKGLFIKDGKKYIIK